PSIQLNRSNNYSDASPLDVQMQVTQIYNTAPYTRSDTSPSVLEGNSDRDFITSMWDELKNSNTSTARMKQIRTTLIRAGAMKKNSDIDKQIQNMIKRRAKMPQGLSPTDNKLFSSDVQEDRYPTGISSPNATFAQDFDAKRFQGFIPEYAIEKQDREDINSTRKGVCRNVAPTMHLQDIPTDVYQSMREALTHNSALPTKVQPERYQLQQHLQQEQQFFSSCEARSSTVFPNCLMQVNDNLISHQHTRFPSQKADGYMQLASEVYQGDRSNTSAFAASSTQWLDAFKIAPTQRDKIDCAVGAAMNLGGAFFAGVLDNNDYKTGKALHPAKK
ncbi:hypothetical protein ACOIXN_004524, partial [Vibrio vulnificus]